MNLRIFKIHRSYSIQFNLPRINVAVFLELNSKGLYLSSEKEKGSGCPVSKFSIKREFKTFSRCSRATTTKFTKTRAARAELLFYLSKPTALLPFSLPSPSSLFKILSE